MISFSAFSPQHPRASSENNTRQSSNEVTAFSPPKKKPFLNDTRGSKSIIVPMGLTFLGAVGTVSAVAYFFLKKHWSDAEQIIKNAKTLATSEQKRLVSELKGVEKSELTAALKEIEDLRSALSTQAKPLSSVNSATPLATVPNLKTYTRSERFWIHASSHYSRFKNNLQRSIQHKPADPNNPWTS